MTPDLVVWACNVGTGACQMLDRHVLNAILCIGLAFAAIAAGWITDAIIAERRR